MNKEIKRICGKKPEEITMVEYQNLKLSMLNQLGRTRKRCDGVECKNCCLNNKDSCTTKVDWSKVPVDTKIIVWDNNWRSDKIKRHFAKFENGAIYAWNNGETSWTTKKDTHVSRWDNAELVEVKIYE